MTQESSSPVDEALATTDAAGLSDVTSAADPASANLQRGALVGRYVVLSRLGQGGMGVVFAAYDPELNRKVALKLLLPRLASSANPATATEARTRLLREAQALAQLNHPHIVAIHDVGEHQGAVWLAMEYVEGQTLSAYLRERRRSWSDVLAIMTPSAVGLAAAHDAGLVHRDIKPDNIMVGADGRVRVMDLGLVRALGGDDDPAGLARTSTPYAAATGRGALSDQVTQEGAIMGTPAYMSPEQIHGQPADARADVFAFCVTLWEALMGERPFAGDTLLALAFNVRSGKVRPVPRDPHARRVPGWLRRVCLHGLAFEPERRFASMHALLEAISRGQRRVRTRRWLAGAALVAVLGASTVAYQRHERAGRVAACEQAGARILDVWNTEARAGVRKSIVATGLSYASATAEKVMPFLDAHAAAWRAGRTRVCVQADVEHTLAAEQLDRAVWCLDERRMELAALLGELGRADQQIVQRAVTAVSRLPPVSSCIDRQVLAALPPPPPAERRAKADVVRTKLSRGRVLLLAGKYTQGLDLSHLALAEAEGLGWPPMTAAARELEGLLLEKSGAFAKAEAVSLAAYLEAAKVRAWDVAAAAAIDLVFNVGYRQVRHAEGKVWAGHAEVAISLAGDPLGLREAARLSNLAAIHQSSDAYVQSTALYERALGNYEKALGPAHPDVASLLNNLATVQLDRGAYAEAKALNERALAIREKALGPAHPDVATSLNNIAQIHRALGAYGEAKVLNERALAIREKALGPAHPDVTASLNNLAVVHSDMGAYGEAKALHERVLGIREKALGPAHPDVARSLSNLAEVHSAMGAYGEAKALNERALGIREKALGPAHRDVALSLNNLAETHQRMGAYGEAKALYERALSIWEKALGPGHANVAYALGNLGGLALAQGRPTEALPLLERAVGIYDGHAGVQEGESENRFRLAQALIHSGGDRTRALAQAGKAAADFRERGAGMAKELAKVEAFLAKHREVR